MTTSPLNQQRAEGQATVRVADLEDAIVRIIGSLGVSPLDAAVTASCLVAAEIEGVSSHGIALAPLYAERLKAGGVSATAKPQIVEDFGALVSMDAAHGLGAVSSEAAIELAMRRAEQHGLAMISVKNAFHFGAASFWTKKLASRGFIGMAFSNTRPLMPAPGGAAAVVGNNPMSIAFPSEAGTPVIVDMAMSATAMGKIRLADAAGTPIPLGWATDAGGTPTTSGSEAIKGMLLPAAGPKGFGLAVAVDLLCGALSGGAIGAAVKPLYGAADQHYGCSHAFLAIDTRKVAAGTGIGAVVDSFADRIRKSAKAPGTSDIYAPGDLERDRRKHRSQKLPLPWPLLKTINDLLAQAGIAQRIQPIS